MTPSAMHVHFYAYSSIITYILVDTGGGILCIENHSKQLAIWTNGAIDKPV